MELKSFNRLEAYKIFHAFGVLFFLISGPVSQRLEAAPTWAGETGTTYQAYRFTTDATAPVATESDNGYGSPTALVSVEEFGAGWQNPEIEYALSGVNSDGAWDLGPNGVIEVSVPCAPPLASVESSYEVEVYVYLIAYEGLVSLPIPSIVDHSVQEETSSMAIVQDGVLGRYKSLTWSGRVTNLSTNVVSFAATASSDGALVDSIEIYTRYTSIPDVSKSYEDWVSENFPGVDNPAITGFEAVPDDDGVPNGLKFYLGRSRFNASPTVTLTGRSQTGLTFSHTRAEGLPSTISDRYEWSIDLGAWHADGSSHDGTTVDFGITSTDTAPSGHDVLTVEANISGAEADSIFVRMLVEKAETNDLDL